MDDLFAPRMPPEPKKRGQWPSEQLAEYLTGKVHPDDVAPAIKSWSAFFIHDAAKQVIAIKTKESRRVALAKIPPSIRGKVQDEIMRIW